MTLPQLTLTLDSLSIPLTKRFGTIGSGTKTLAYRFYARQAPNHPGAWICELWLANALAGMEIIDWRKLTITIPPNMTVDAYPRVGMAIVSGHLIFGTGATQCFPTRRGIAPIRFVLNGPASLMDEGVIPDVVTNFGALGQKQPAVDRSKYADHASSDLWTLRAAINHGVTWTPIMPGLDTECGIMHKALGVWLPLGPSSPGNPGGDNPAGSDIRFLPGYDQTLAGALLERERMDRVIERSLHAWDAHGNYLTVESFGDPSPQYSGSRDPWSTDAELPGYTKPGGPSHCPYVRDLEAVGAYGAAHLERAINPTLVAWEYLKDPVAADFMVDLAEEMRLQFSNLGPVAAATDSWQPRNLRNYLAMANRNPHHGGDCGRYRGVPAWCVATAYHIRPSPAYVAWMQMWCQWCDLCQMENGLRKWSVGDEQMHNPPGAASTQCFEELYVSVARVACGRAIGEVQPGASILRTIDALFVNRKLPRQPYFYNHGSFGAPHFIRVGNADTGEPDPVISAPGWAAPGESPVGDPTNCEMAIALAWHVSGGAAKYRDALLTYGVPAPTIAAKAANCLAGMDLNWNAGALASMQQAIAQVAP